MCNGIISSALGYFGVFIEWFWGVLSEMYFTNWVKAAERDKFRASSMKFNSEIHCLHGLEELISSDVTRVEIPQLYLKVHRLDT